ncbi:MAG: hypothetical protein KAT34_13050 [Candidatus Aminicenantes bacterium]|nr:hypothetical protein [Candidatus Aminicenantes bacterium]
MKRPVFFVIFIIVLFLLIQASAREKEDNYSYRNVLIKMKAHFEKIKTYRCLFESFTAKGEKTKLVVCNYFYKSPGMIRMEILEGKYNGTVMLYKPHKVRLKLGRGILSWFSFSYKPEHDWVTDLRDYGLHQSHWGWYIDQHIRMLELADGTFSGEEVAAGRDTIKYTIVSKESQKTRSIAKEILWVDKREFIPVKYVQYDSLGKIIMSNLHKDIKLNIKLDNKLFRKFKRYKPN